MTAQFLRSCFAITAIILVTSIAATAQDSLGRSTLRGLRGVKVSIDSFIPEAQEGLTLNQLQTDVELRLRKAGIRVLTDQEWLKTPGMPALYVIVPTHKTDIGLYAVSIRVKFRQSVTLVRQPNSPSVLAGTYETNTYIGVIGTKRLRELRDRVADQVDIFINDYLAENPKH